MSNPDPDTTADAAPTHREGIADAFGRDLDPLAQHAPTFERLSFDPFEAFREEVLDSKGLTDKTRGAWETSFDYWRAYMAEQGRHPACPNERHVLGFAHHLHEKRDIGGKHSRDRLRHIQSAFEFWQNDTGFPHMTDFNPFATALEKVTFEDAGPKPYHDLGLDDLRERVESIKHVRDRALVVTQLKLGLRAGEVTNIRLEDVSLDHSDLDRDYPHLGTHPRVEDRENAIYIPPSEERPGNKSDHPRILPLDTEVRQVFIDYLLPRPTDGQPWLFLTQSASQMRPRVVREAWEDAFHPRYAETEAHRGINSHFGRHWFSNFWEDQRATLGLPLKSLQYMRGDTISAVEGQHNSVDAYLRATYDDIEQVYRDHIFPLRI